MVRFGSHRNEKPTEAFDGRKCGFRHDLWPEPLALSQFPVEEMGKAVGGADVEEMNSVLLT